MLTRTCLQGSLLARRRPETARRRLELNDRLIAHARTAGDRSGVELGESIRVALLGECGEVAAMATALPRAVKRAEQRRLWSIWPALALLQSSWSGLRGDHRSAADTLGRVQETTAALSLTHFRGAVEFTRLLNPY